MSSSSTADALLAAASKLSADLASLPFSDPVTHVYNPLEYAWDPHSQYIRKFSGGKKLALFLGMNPGPFGMAQTGVPFGEVAAVRDWMGITGKVHRPAVEHEKRRVEGFACKRSEVSGRRLWGWAQSVFGSPERFFANAFVVNYCPLIWLEVSGKSRTPDKISSAEMAPVIAACDQHLRKVIEILEPKWLIGVGGFAEAKFQGVSDPGKNAAITRIAHPSPANPAANRDWAGTVERELIAAGVWKDLLAKV